ncbi:PDT-domain-containing protein [Neolentinus lepideus HHB14362 ss-1]|uniref:prephenate dehydratase n=1 Tax=Neolentinus lepideus HHB14362 ss-1 TaxID=1314782 RepID=A0A165W0M1_9AGAM|nr:PDT-domain-containing protein [Neolentinus lepideus HHB14362 ss-1]
MCPRLAFLGPVGTYSHQAACNRFEDSVEYCERGTIADVFNALSDEIPLALIPQENSLFGSVVETYNLLRLPCAGRDKFVVGEVTHSIRHSLLVRKGATLASLKRVYSHEQALGQCDAFLKTHLPDAVRVRLSSTAAAAAMISKSDEHANDAAICSAHCISTFDGLQVLREGIQDRDTNVTRFFIMSTTQDSRVPLQTSSPPSHALLRVSLRKQEPVNRIIISLGLDIVRVDRRPLPGGNAFDSCFFLELLDPRTNASEGLSWAEAVDQGIDKLRKNGFDCILLGIW